MCARSKVIKSHVMQVNAGGENQRKRLQLTLVSKIEKLNNKYIATHDIKMMHTFCMSCNVWKIRPELVSFCKKVLVCKRSKSQSNTVLQCRVV